jgi:hypothetical protein
MNTTLPWHDEAEVLGVRIRAFFFNPLEVDARSEFTARQLPVLQGAIPRLLGVEGQREAYATSALLAHPDAVLAHGTGLLCLTYRGGDGRLFDTAHWRSQCRVDAMLQCIATTMAVAGKTQLPTAALWRGANVLCQFDPSPPVLECLGSHIGAARQYWNEPQHVSPAQLASFCEPRLRALPGLARGDVLAA